MAVQTQNAPWTGTQRGNDYQDNDWSAIEQRLRQAAEEEGLSYDPSDLEGIKRNVSYTDAAGNPTGATLDQAVQNQVANYGQRASNTPGGGASSGGSGGGSVAQQWNAQPTDPRADALYAQLLERSQQSLDVDRNNPVIRQQADAFSANQTRAQRNYISDTAERLGPFAGGALQGERRMAAERAGIASGAFEAELIGREVAALRDEKAQALALLTGRISAEEEARLRREIAELDATLQREGMSLTRDLGFAGMDLQRRGLDQGFDQFLRQLAQRQYEFDETLPYF